MVTARIRALAARFGWSDDELAAVLEALDGARYAEGDPIGRGGTSEVHRRRDLDLARDVAMKVLHGPLEPARKARFLAEAQTTARLQHPGVVPVYEIGEDAAGRPWFTMALVRGRTLRDVVADLRVAVGRGQTETPDGWNLARLVGAFQQVCDTVAYAHASGVLHRDLKPSNLMVGRFGEVRVLDWGLATGSTEGEGVVGTPAYMAPEQARGAPATPASDAASLGAVLYTLLTGETPYRGSPREVIAQVARGEPPLPVARLGHAPELAELARRAMDPDPGARPTVAAMSDAVRDWLDGTLRREQAAALVGRAGDLRRRAVGLRAEAADRRARAERPDEAPDRWVALDDAAALEIEADRADLEADGLLRGAIAQAPDRIDAIEDLVERTLAAFREAERVGDVLRAADTELALRGLSAALPADRRGRVERWLAGDGAVTLWTDPPGAVVRAYRFERRLRRLTPVDHGVIGVSPLTRARLPHGSWLLEVVHPERASVWYPVVLGREELWDGVPPGESEPAVIPLLGAEALGPDGCYVPAGWFAAGGDDRAEGHPLPARRLWCDGVVFSRFPVTNAEFLRFLDAIPAEQADRHVPRDRTDALGAAGPPLMARGGDGRHQLVPDLEGDLWQPDWAASMVDFPGAVAYARWRAAEDGHPWRLPAELEWEKAARGVDGRTYPWGTVLEPSWACHVRSGTGRRMPVSVHAYPVDTSVYGVRCTAGTIQEWMADLYDASGPGTSGDRVDVPHVGDPIPTDPDHLRVLRGGHWYGPASLCRLASRLATEPLNRAFHLGFRVVRSVPPAGGGTPR